MEKMSEEVMHEVVNSLAKIGKQWDLGGESVGRVWGFLLFMSCPVTQREIEEGTGYSRGLISRCLRELKKTPLLEVSRVGNENLYSINTSLTEGLDELLKRFLTAKITPMIELLSGTADKIEDAKVRETFLALLHEYKKLKLAVLIFSRVMEDINIDEIVEETEDIEDYVKKVDYKGGNKSENE
jgi:DNA-binding transcriptional regulator GbsR (MarR family)